MPVVPTEGYRLSRFRDVETGICLPVLGAAVSAEKVFDIFLDLLEPLGVALVDVGVVLARELAVGGLDRLVVGGPLDSERVVIVFEFHVFRRGSGAGLASPRRFGRLGKV